MLRLRVPAERDSWVAFSAVDELPSVSCQASGERTRRLLLVLSSMPRCGAIDEADGLLHCVCVFMRVCVCMRVGAEATVYTSMTRLEHIGVDGWPVG